MKTYLLVKNGVVENAIVWDGQTEWTAPASTEAVELPTGSPAWIGWLYDGKEFSSPDAGIAQNAGAS